MYICFWRWYLHITRMENSVITVDNYKIYLAFIVKFRFGSNFPLVADGKKSNRHIALFHGFQFQMLITTDEWLCWLRFMLTAGSWWKLILNWKFSKKWKFWRYFFIIGFNCKYSKKHFNLLVLYIFFVYAKIILTMVFRIFIEY